MCAAIVGQQVPDATTIERPVGANLCCARKNPSLEFLQVSGFKGVGL
jgi:hypothetical protein